MPHTIRIERALLSVSDKRGLAEFARGLAECGVEMFSSGGTRKHLEKEGISVREVAEYTGFPEMLDGRIKTLHPKIHGGILCRHDREDDLQSLQAHGILKFDLVVVNLYPFEETVARPGVVWDEAIEQIDIGGPTLVRGAAKNHAFVTLATSPDQYDGILDAVRNEGGTNLAQRRHLAAAAFAHTAAYDGAIADYFARQLAAKNAAKDQATPALPETWPLNLRRKALLRYGENPYQAAALYERVGHEEPCLINARQLHGKELSYNNWLDLSAAWEVVRNWPAPAVSVIKHNNPCGAAAHENLAMATRRAMDGDPLSAFGSVLAFNREMDAASAEVLAEPDRFVEAIIAPGFAADAVEILTTKPKWKANVRLMELGATPPVADAWHFRHIDGGFLVQQQVAGLDADTSWEHVAGPELDDATRQELRFAWEMVRHVKSNAIVVCREQSLCGAGAGQMSRVDSVEIALKKAGKRSREAVLASDAFFPFPDSIHFAAEAGIRAVIQPGGSRRDAEVIAACQERNITMLFTGRRHFRH